MKKALLGTTAGTPIEVWFQDEARVGQKGSLTYVWAPIGSCPLMVRDNRHDSAYLFGAICPVRAVGAAIIMPAANAEAMNEHLTEISTQVASGAHAVVVCDRAGWHQTGGRPPVAVEYTDSCYFELERSGRKVFGGFDPVKKPGPWAVADLRVVTPPGVPD